MQWSLVKSQTVPLYLLNRSDVLQKLKSVNFNSRPLLSSARTCMQITSCLLCVCAFFFPSGVELVFFGNFCKKSTEGTTCKSYSVTNSFDSINHLTDFSAPWSLIYVLEMSESDTPITQLKVKEISCTFRLLAFIAHRGFKCSTKRWVDTWVNWYT